jgi:hypothetical protein
MQAPPTLAPLSPPNLSLLETEALRKALAQGGMPEIFFTTVERVVAGLIVEAIERDRLCRSDLFQRGTRV